MKTKTYQVFFDRLEADSVFVEVLEDAGDQAIIDAAWEQITAGGYEREEIVEASFDWQEEA